MNTTMKNAVPENKPWYRHPFVWLLIALPLSAVIGGFVTLYIAARTNDGLVSDDYYQRGKEINKDLHRDEAASAQNLHAQMLLGSDMRTLRVLLNQPVSGELQLKLMHPTRAGFDQSTKLSPQGPQMWTSTLPQPLAQSAWQVELSDTAGQWRLYGAWKVQPDQALSLSPDTDIRH